MESCERLESLAAVSDFRPCGVSFDNRERHSDSRSARARGPRAAGVRRCRLEAAPPAPAPPPATGEDRPRPRAVKPRAARPRRATLSLVLTHITVLNTRCCSIHLDTLSPESYPGSLDPADVDDAQYLSVIEE